MSRFVLLMFILLMLNGCMNENGQAKRIPVAMAGNNVLYYDEIAAYVKGSANPTDSIAALQTYINTWAKRELMFQKAETNLPPERLEGIEKQLDETRINLIVYEYQRMMMLERMDTIISEDELEKYYTANQNNFILNSNIVKALYIKLPSETPNIWRIKSLARSNQQKDMQELESICYQFAEKFDDFNEDWITMDRLLFEIKEDIGNQESFLRRTRFYEATDSVSVYLMAINDYRLRGSVAPFEYVKEDIKRVIWNNRRLVFIRELENGIYDEAIKANSFKIY